MINARPDYDLTRVIPRLQKVSMVNSITRLSDSTIQFRLLLLSEILPQHIRQRWMFFLLLSQTTLCDTPFILLKPIEL
jgi:type III secretory pathway component EscS